VRILIVDDEPLARERLIQLLEDIGDTEVAGSVANGKQALEWLSNNPADVVLLDIRMPVMDGLETAQHLRQMEHAPAVVFCTAFDEHALDAFDANAIDYVMKPVRGERLERSLLKAGQLNSSAAEAIKPVQRSHLCANVRGQLKLIELEDVFCLIAEHKYVTVTHRDGETLIEDSLKSLEAEFREHFLRVHRRALVGIRHIAGLGKNEDGQTVIRLHETDHELVISRRNLSAVRKTLKQL